MNELYRDRYEPRRQLGAGGQGRVVRAWDHLHQRHVVLKLRSADGDEAARAALLAEGRVLLEVRPHRGLPLLRDDFFADGSYVLVMDWIEGQSLEQVLAERGNPGLAPSLVLGWLGQVAEALDHLHQHAPAIIHADVKPANLVLTPSGQVVLVDFGLAARGEAALRGGTRGYIAPEVAAGNRPSPASDVFGLAATATALLSGVAPAGGRPSWDGLPSRAAGALERALRRGLATDPARRPKSAGELVERLSGSVENALPGGVVTFLTTDIDRALELWETHPEAMNEVRARYDAAVADAVDGAGGTPVSTGGAGERTLSVFTTASAAAVAALALTEALGRVRWPPLIAPRVRIALHSGEAQPRGGDYAGPVAGRAEALRALARADAAIVVSRATGDLIGDALPPGAALTAAGEISYLGRTVRAAGSSPPEKPPVELGREALTRRDWPVAFAELARAQETGTALAADELEGLGDAAVWSGHPQESLQARQQAFAAYVRAGKTRRAAGVAMGLTVNALVRLNLSVATGWLAKARRLLDALPEGPEHGHFYATEALFCLAKGELAAAEERGRATVNNARKFNDEDALALGLTFQGAALVRQGKVNEGLPLLDEAMANASGGELGPWATGLVYCRTLCACMDLHDYRRALEWSDAVERWAVTSGTVGFPGDCRVHRAEILTLQGEWQKAEAEAAVACAEAETFDLGHTGLANYAIGEIRLRSGDLPAAEAAFYRANELGIVPQPGMALLRLAEGKAHVALVSLKVALADIGADPLRRARLLPAYVEIAIAAGELEVARGSAAELDAIATGYGTTALRAAAEGSLGALAVARGEPEEAARRLRLSGKLWREVGAPYEVARARLRLAAVLADAGDQEGARMEAHASFSGLEKLGARPDAARAAEILARG